VTKATEWYATAGRPAFAQEVEPTAAYCAGASEPLLCDPLQPFPYRPDEKGRHHRAVDGDRQSPIQEITARIASASGYPDYRRLRMAWVFVSDIGAGRRRAVAPAYNFVIHYDLDVGVRIRPAGLTDLREIVADACRLCNGGHGDADVRAPFQEAAWRRPR